MVDGQQQVSSDEKSTKMKATLIAFRQVGLPLLQALSENGAQSGAPSESEGVRFGAMVQSTVDLSKKLADQLGAEDDLDAWVRWALVGSASQMVAGAFQATGQAMSPDQTSGLAALVVDLQTKFKTQIPAGQETIPNTAATFRARMLEAMVPVVGAIARYSFGRAEHALIGEVAEKIVRTADQVTRALAPSGATPEEWRLLCWNILRASGQIYADAHYAEADRLLYMDAAARASYFAQHGDVPPMTQVWQSFNQRLAMLSTLASYLDAPQSAELDVGALA